MESVTQNLLAASRVSLPLTLTSYLHHKYGLEIEFVGSHDLRAAEEVANLRNGKIQVGEARTAEQQGFILAHVFGHIVQYLAPEKYSSLLSVLEMPPPIAMSTRVKREYFLFEMEAYAWGDRLIEECFGFTAELKHRYATYAVVDFSTYSNYLAKGTRTPADRFQLLYQRSLAVAKRRLWASTNMRLPKALTLRPDVDISVV